MEHLDISGSCRGSERCCVQSPVPVTTGQREEDCLVSRIGCTLISDDLDNGHVLGLIIDTALQTPEQSPIDRGEVQSEA